MLYGFIAVYFAGGIGNLIDRIFRDRHATDFINLGLSQIWKDIFLMLPMLVLSYYSFISQEKLAYSKRYAAYLIDCLPKLLRRSFYPI
jgi:lipoprotein signal peptidase